VYAGVDAASQRRLNMIFKGCLRYIHSLRRLDHVFHLKSSALLATIQHLSFLYKVLHVRHPCYRPRARSSLTCDESVLCCTWLSGVKCAASWHVDFAYAGFISFRCKEDSPWRRCFELSY
jgi:hypothetical protein